MKTIDKSSEKEPFSKMDKTLHELSRLEDACRHSAATHKLISAYWVTAHWALWIFLIILILLSPVLLKVFHGNAYLPELISGIIVCLGTILFFLKPLYRAEIHLSAGYRYDSLKESVRSLQNKVDKRDQSEVILNQELRYFSELKAQIQKYYFPNGHAKIIL